MESNLVIFAITALGVTFLATLPAIVASFHQRARARNVQQPTADKKYQDEDGEATPESVAAFSTKWQRLAVLFFAAAGLGCQTALAVLLKASPLGEGKFALQNWAITASWALLTIQAIAVAANRDSVRAYYQGIRLSGCSLVVGSVLLAELNEAPTWSKKTGRVCLILCAATAVSAVGLVLASLSLPRRPDVFFRGRLVDRMFTVNALNRLTFGWATTLMAYASKKGDLELPDLPALSHQMRPAEQSVEWNTRRKGDSVFKTLLKIYGWATFRQWAISIANTAVSYLPWWITLRLLEALESRKPGEETVGSRLWLYLVWLGIAKIAGALLESYLFWSVITDMYVPMRSQLSAIIFEKAMRRKNVKGTSKANKPSDTTTATTTTTTTTATNQDSTESSDTTAAANKQPATTEADDAKKDGDKTKDGEEATDQKSRQAVINLVGVDAKRVSDFSLFQYMFPTTILQLGISTWFLVSLLGWKPLLVGIFSVTLTLPINTYYSKRIFKLDEKQMKIRDAKLELVNEALQGIRQIKFAALEPQWEKRILDLRQQELDTLWELFESDIVLNVAWTAVPILLSLTSLGSYAWMNGSLSASVAFVSIGILNTLDFAVAAMPGLIRFGIDCWVSLKRIEKYLDGPELVPIRTESDRPDVAFEDASLAWPVHDNSSPDKDKPSDEQQQQQQQEEESSRFVLRNVTLSFPPGELSVISGKTGSGKSLMLAAVLGEVDLLSGSVYIPRPPTIAERNDADANPSNWILPASIAYVGQIPWIENATLKDNILFGLPFIEERYTATLDACALTKDLATLTDGDKTELGVNGVNLSGGQKWRVTVARALYSRAGILVMDDIFSAVDAHVSRHILNSLDGELCKGRTRILVTHHVGLVEKKAKFVVELADGGVRYAGSTENLDLEEIKRTESPTGEGTNKKVAETEDGGQEEGQEETETPLKKQDSKIPKKFVEEETREKGRVKARIYGIYLKSSGGWVYWAIMMALYLGFQASEIAQPWVLRLWTGENEAMNMTTSFVPKPRPNFHFDQFTILPIETHPFHPTPTISGTPRGVRFWLTIYALVCLSGILFGTARFFLLFVISYRASKVLFRRILFQVLRAPLRWTDTVPVGRILNRFTADFNAVDSNLSQMGSWFLHTVLQALGVCVASLFVSPLMAPAAALCLAWCIYLGKVYLAAARPAKRLESTAKSPVFDFFGSCLTGLVSIRAFDKTAAYTDKMHGKVGEQSSCSMNLYLFNRWIGWNMSVAGIFFTVVVTMFVLLRPGIDAALAGFVLSFTMQFSSTVLMTVRAYANLELEMNAVERVIEYSEIETEDLGGEKPPAAWPTEGRLEVEDLVVSYAPELEPVIKGVSFRINGGERVGVVGRTGAGKSTLTLALFRFLEAKSGTIHIDGLDISKITLADLRSRLAIIPQDPVLFSGTVRSNLDPFDDHTDADLHDSLRRVHLVSSVDSETASTTVTVGDNGSVTPSSSSSTDAATLAATGPKNINIFRSLTSPIAEGGHNLSQGQRQLLCLARAIVSRPKVLVLDEATSAVDMATDTLIQRSIRDEFGGSTLMVIAHRLSTIADFDRILVLGDGEVLEFGTPRELWEKQGGVFRGMCEESGEREGLRATILGEGRARDV